MYVANVFSGITIIHFMASKARVPNGKISRMAPRYGYNIKKIMNTIHFIPKG